MDFHCGATVEPLWTHCGSSPRYGCWTLMAYFPILFDWKYILKVCLGPGMRQVLSTIPLQWLHSGSTVAPQLETRKRLPNAGFPQWAHGWTTDGQYTRDVDLGMGRRKGSDLGMWKACYFCRCMATKDDATGCGTARHETRRLYEKNSYDKIRIPVCRPCATKSTSSSRHFVWTWFPIPQEYHYIP